MWRSELARSLPPLDDGDDDDDESSLLEYEYEEYVDAPDAATGPPQRRFRTNC
jgi:hypothetical protein